MNWAYIFTTSVDTFFIITLSDHFAPFRSANARNDNNVDQWFTSEMKRFVIERDIAFRNWRRTQLDAEEEK